MEAKDLRIGNLEQSAKEKATELVEKFLPYSRDWDVEKYSIFNAKKCALICVDEIQEYTQMISSDYEGYTRPYYYFLKVREEIKNFK